MILQILGQGIVRLAGAMFPERNRCQAMPSTFPVLPRSRDGPWEEYYLISKRRRMRPVYSDIP